MQLEASNTLDNIFSEAILDIHNAIHDVVRFNELTDNICMENSASTEKEKFRFMEALFESLAKIHKTLETLQADMEENPQEKLTQTKRSFFIIRGVQSEFVLLISQPAVERNGCYMSEGNPDQGKIDFILSFSVKIEEEFEKLLLSPTLRYDDLLLTTPDLPNPTFN